MRVRGWMVLLACGVALAGCRSDGGSRGDGAAAAGQERAGSKPAGDDPEAKDDEGERSTEEGSDGSSGSAAAADPKLPEPKTVEAPEEEQLGSRSDRGPSVGDEVPDWEAQTWEGERLAFEDLLAEAPLLIVFYRGGW